MDGERVTQSPIILRITLTDSMLRRLNEMTGEITLDSNSPVDVYIQVDGHDIAIKSYPIITNKPVCK